MLGEIVLKILVPFLMLMCVISGFMAQKHCSCHDFDKQATVPLRGWLSLIVVFGHLDTALGRSIPFINLFHLEGMAVSVFFFMSGYGYMRSASVRGKEYLEGFIWRTGLKLLLPFLFAMIVSWPLVGLPAIGEILTKLRYGEVAILLHSWFVFALLFLSLLFYMAFKYSSVRYLEIVIWSSVAILYVVLRYLLVWPSWWWGSLWAFPVGVTYCAMEAKVKQLIQKCRLKFYLVIDVVWAMTVVIAVMVSGGMPFFSELPHALLGVAIVLVLYMFPITWGITIGKISYEIYLSHGIFEKFFLAFALPPAIYITFVILCTFVCSVSIRQFVELVKLRHDRREI